MTSKSVAAVALALGVGASALGQMTYVVGDTMEFDYALPNSTDSLVAVWLNWGDGSCVDDATDCLLLGTQANSGSVLLTPDYYSSEARQSTAQMALPSGVAGSVDLCFFNQSQSASSEYAVFAQATFYQPLLFEPSSLSSGGAWQCGSQLPSLTVQVRTSLLSNDPPHSYQLALAAESADGSLWTSALLLAGVVDSVAEERLGWSTVYLTDATVPLDCPSGDSALLLLLAYGTALQPFRFYASLGMSDMERFMVFELNSFAAQLPQQSLEQYEPVQLTVSDANVNRSEASDPPLLVALSSGPLSMATVGCQAPYSARDYSSFGWFGRLVRVESNGSFVNQDAAFASGAQLLAVYYYPLEAHADWDALDDFAIHLDKYRLSEYVAVRVWDFDNGTYAEPMTLRLVDSDDSLTVGKTYKFTISTSFDTSQTEIWYSLEQASDSGEKACSTSAQRVPDLADWQLEIPTDCDASLKLALTLLAFPCNNQQAQPLSVTHMFELAKKHHKSSGDGALSVGAIIGIACGCVFVVGLAAWWFLAKRGAPEDGYAHMD